LRQDTQQMKKSMEDNSAQLDSKYKALSNNQDSIQQVFLSTLRQEIDNSITISQDYTRTQVSESDRLLNHRISEISHTTKAQEVTSHSQTFLEHEAKLNSITTE